MHSLAAYQGPNKPELVGYLQRWKTTIYLNIFGFQSWTGMMEGTRYLFSLWATP